jgi:hypothetical protein
MRRFLRASVLTLAIAATTTAAAHAASTPGWECIPTTAGKPVVSGGTGSAPSCKTKTTAVLAPTYVASGVGNEPTVQLSAVNLQVVDGSGATSTINGTGKVVIGYAEGTAGTSRTGSHDLILGSQNSWTSYGSLVGGSYNQATAPNTTALGYYDTASGQWAVAAGYDNTASGQNSAVLGGAINVASTNYASVTGGSGNTADQ